MFTFYKQLNAMDCGATCLRMVAKYHGKHYTADTLRQMAGQSKAGVSLLGLSDTAEKIGLRTRGVKITFEQLNSIDLPCILHWDQNHFVVLKKIRNKKIEVADPAKGIISLSKEQFLGHWISSNDTAKREAGLALLLEPTPVFYNQENQEEQKLSWTIVFQYLRSAKWQISQVFIALLISSVFQLIFPFLTQSIVDTGINAQNMQYVTVVLLAQLMLTFSQSIVGFIRSRLLLRISNLLNIQVLSDFWIKLTKLPLSYFNAHQVGDTMQRIGDTKQIQHFLTGTALNTFFSIFNFLVYAIVLVVYNVQLFVIFCIGSIFYFGWIQLFLRLRARINYQTFHLSSKENNSTLELIQGMQEIRLNNAEKQKRWEWENLQANVFKLNFKSLNYGQIQAAGATFINQVQSLVISFLVASLVINGKLTLGSMLAIQYIIGQLSGPIEQWVGFVQNFQDARISMERLNEIHQMQNEEDDAKKYILDVADQQNIVLKNVSFSYPGAGNEPVLKGINLTIPENRITAIVGASGSGKTTLLKLLLKVYDSYDGEIRIGSVHDADKQFEGIRFNFISHRYWRGICGSVLQDGYIFNDSIARNVAFGQEEIDYDRLVHSCTIANIDSFIQAMPNGYHSKLGADGVGISQGQKQRILIARAIYKNPKYLFFDEATNSLDAKNEKQISEKLDSYFQGKTVVIVAHRLSTVKNASKIVVLDQGMIVEEGTHEELSRLGGKYFELVRNQLELGN